MTRAIEWMSQHAKHAQEVIQLGYHDNADWNTFFPIELMAEYPSQSVRNFTKYQLKPKNT